MNQKYTFSSAQSRVTGWGGCHSCNRGRAGAHPAHVTNLSRLTQTDNLSHSWPI